MFRIPIVVTIPVLVGLVGGPLLLLGQARGAMPADGLGGYATAALMGGALGLLVVAPNVLGALLVNKIGIRSWRLNSALFAAVALACFAFLIDWLSAMLRIVGGIDLLAERGAPWGLFLVNLILCCIVHRRGSFLPKKVRTVS